MPPKLDWNTEPELIELMNFLIERTQGTKSPLTINHLAKEFKEESGCSQVILCLISRIKLLREKAAKSNTIDTATKVKMMFALSASIDEHLLKGLQEVADVEIDEKNRITKYKAKDGSLELTGDHNRSARIKDSWKRRRTWSQERSNSLSQEYMSTTPGSMMRSSKRTKVESEDYAPDNSAGISEFRPAPSGIQLLRQLEGAPGANDMPPKRSNNWKSDPEYIELMNFLIERTHGTKSPLNIHLLASEFKEKTGCSQGMTSLACRIRTLRGKVAESDTIDAITKVKMMFALSAPIDTRYLKELQNVADVEIDGNRRITKYRAKYGNFILEGDHSSLAKHKKGAEMNTIDTETKVKMIIALSVSIDENLLNELRKNAHVEIDGNNRITKYRAKNGSLELTGDHIPSAKMNDDKKMEDSTPKTSESVKRAATEVSNPSKRAGEMKIEGFAPDDSERISEFRAREPEIQLLREPKLEVQEAQIFRSHDAPRASRAQGPPTIPKSEADGAPEAPIPTKSNDSVRIPSREPKPGIQLLRDPKLEEDPIFRSHGAPEAHIPRALLIKTELGAED